jgi:hypothetical protein
MLMLRPHSSAQLPLSENDSICIIIVSQVTKTKILIA